MIKLYYAPNSCSLAPHIALEDAGATYKAILVDFSKEEQRSPEFLALNPKGRVPALLTGNGVVSENPAILSYIAQSFPDANLAPIGDPFAFAQVQAFNAYIASTLHVAHAHGRRASRWADSPAAIADMRNKMPEVVAACFQTIERDMFIGPYVMGEQYTICDAYLFTLAQWMEGDKVDPTTVPNIHAHREMMLQRPPVQRAIQQESAAQ